MKRIPMLICIAFATASSSALAIDLGSAPPGPSDTRPDAIVRVQLGGPQQPTNQGQAVSSAAKAAKAAAKASGQKVGPAVSSAVRAAK